jgi:PAS domain S-box-containing protein
MGDQLRVLLIEDSAHDAELLVRQLRKGGYEPVWERVETAEAMTEALEHGSWDVILCDFKLPRFDGQSALEIVRDRGLDLPFIIISGFLGEESAVGLLKAGASDFIIKGNWARLIPGIDRELREAKNRTERRRTQERQKLATQILELLNRSSERTGVIRDIILLIHESTGFDAVGIRLKEDDDFPYYETRGFTEPFLEAERYLCARDQAGELIRDLEGNPVLECMCGNIIQGRIDSSLPFFTPAGSFWTNSTTALLAATTEKNRQARTRNRCIAEGYESVALIPLRSGDKTIGLLQLNDRRKGMFTPEMIKYFEGIGASIGISLERKQSEEELRKYRDHLEELVKERTAELRTTNKQLHQEIIERKQTEGKLNEQFEFLKILMDTIPNPIFYKDIEGKYTGCNKAYEEFIDKSRDEIIGKTVYDMGPKEISDQYHEKDKELFQNPGKQEYEWKVKRKSGEIRNVVFCKATFTDSNGNVAGLIGVILDVTERKHTEEKLRIAKEQAEAASRAKSEFLANTSHELRTPLNAIMGYAQILKKQKNLTEKQKDQIGTIQSSGEHLLNLINDILDLARIEAQKEEVQFEEFNLPTLIREVLSTNKVKATEKNLAFHYQEGSAFPQMVRGDARKLRQVLLNLLDNAIKYTKSGSVTLQVSGENGKEERQRTMDEGRGAKGDWKPATSNQQRVTFQISDTGIGIAEENLETIFEPFTKVDIQGRSTEGSGLGLAISRRLIELMGGRLTVESPSNCRLSMDDFRLKDNSKIQCPDNHQSSINNHQSTGGPGSTFRVELEMEVVEGVEEAARAPERAVIGYRGQRKKVLIADDNITNLSMLMSMLEPLGFEIETAENGEEAVGRAAESRPDLILMDLMMPIMNGHEAMRRIRENEDLKKIKVVGVSAAVADKDRAGAFAADCDGFISKPVETGELLDKLKEQLEIEWIESEDGGRGTRDEGRRTKDEEAGPEKMPPRRILEQIIQHAERGEFTKLGRILDELESEDADYSGFCDLVREYARRYDDEGIVEYIKSKE